MKIKSLFVLLFSIFVLDSFSQSTLPQFAVYSPDDLNIKQCDFDKEADAVVLLDEAFSNYDDEYKLITQRRIRLKILNKRGMDRGNISIPFYSKDGFEFIRSIEGITYDPQTNNTYELNRKSIYTEKVDDRISRIKFAMPNVKEGSIIEYKYVSIMKHYGGLDHWSFQSDIPTLKSCYSLQIIPNAEFNYVLSKKSEYQVVIKPKPDVGQIYFEMNNIPGLRFEPFMDAPKDYFQRVEFQFSGYINQFGNKKNVNNTWEELSASLASDDQLGGTAKKALPIPEELKIAVEQETTNKGKATVIYNYVRKNFTWNGIDSKYTDNIKKVAENRTGTSGEMNLILLNFLKFFKLDASPMIVAERKFGKIYPDFPFVDRFNKTVVYANVDGENLVLDASGKYNQFGLLSYSLLNTTGLLIDKKQGKLIELKSNSEAFKMQVNFLASIDKNGKLVGRAKILSNEYAKQIQLEEAKADEKNYLFKTFEQPYDGLHIDSFQIVYPLKDTDQLMQTLKFSKELTESDGFVLFNYNLFTGLTKTPFTAAERFTNINFGYPYNETFEETIDLPVNTKVDLPANKTLVNYAGNISISRTIRKDGDQLKVKISFNQNVTHLSYNDYSEVKEFYKQMIILLNEPIVLKITKS